MEKRRGKERKWGKEEKEKGTEAGGKGILTELRTEAGRLAGKEVWGEADWWMLSDRQDTESSGCFFLSGMTAMYFREYKIESSHQKEMTKRGG